MSNMRIGRAALPFAALIALGAAFPAASRTVVYPESMVAIQAAADDQGIAGPFSETPGPGVMRIALDAPQAADHKVLIASVYCKAYKIENPVSSLLADLIKSANATPADGAPPDAPALTLRILSGSSVLRCLGKGEVQTVCKNRVRLTAEAQFTRPDGTSAAMPIISQVERDGRVGGFCGNIARYTGIVTREAAIDLIRQARQAAGG